MKGLVGKILTILVGAAILFLPAAPVLAFGGRGMGGAGGFGGPVGFHDFHDFHDNFRRPGFPDEEGQRRGTLSPMGQDRARRAMQQGEILPLSDIRRRVRDQFGGKIVGVDLAERHEDSAHSPPWIYDIRVLSPEGRVLSVQMDASDGRVIEVRGQR